MKNVWWLKHSGWMGLVQLICILISVIFAFVLQQNVDLFYLPLIIWVLVLAFVGFMPIIWPSILKKYETIWVIVLYLVGIGGLLIAIAVMSYMR